MRTADVDVVFGFHAIHGQGLAGGVAVADAAVGAFEVLDGRAWRGLGAGVGPLDAHFSALGFDAHFDAASISSDGEDGHDGEDDDDDGDPEGLLLKDCFHKFFFLLFALKPIPQFPPGNPQFLFPRLLQTPKRVHKDIPSFHNQPQGYEF